MKKRGVKTALTALLLSLALLFAGSCMRTAANDGFSRSTAAADSPALGICSLQESAGGGNIAEKLDNKSSGSASKLEDEGASWVAGLFIFLGVIFIAFVILTIVIYINKRGQTYSSKTLPRQPDEKPGQSGDDIRYCPDCGTALPQNAHFCPKCGRKTGN